MNKKKKRNLFLLLILVLFVSVGYALLSTTLNINGTTKVKDAKWDIHWENPEVQEGSVTTTLPTIDSLKTTASFNVTLEKPGDFYEFTIDAKNAGTIDGMISAVSYKLNDTEISETNKLPDYLNYTVTYSDGVELEENHLLAANTSEKYRVRVEFKKDIDNSQLPGQEVTLDLKFAVTYVQADGNATGAHPSAITYINRQNEGQITPGDLIGIGETEDFYVISSDNSANGKTVLLAKYSLLVGDIYENHQITGTIDQSTPGYGLQSVDAIGGYDQGTGYGTVAFSSTNYWDDGNGTLLSPYNANGASYSGNPYPYVYDTNSNIYQYISGNGGYVDKLKEMGAPSTITGRLLTYEEADANQTVEVDNKSIIFNENEYWLGSAASDYNFFDVRYYDTITGDFFDIDSGFGVRPVIEIPTSELQ